MASVNVISTGGKCINFSTAASQLVYGDYIISTSTYDRYESGEPAPKFGVWNRVTDEWKTFTYINLTGSPGHYVQPVEMDGDPWIVWWPAGSGDLDAQAARIDPATVEVLERIMLSYGDHPSGITWPHNGLRWSLRGKGAVGPCGWTYGTTAVRITPPIGGTTLSYFHDNGDLWTYNGSSGVARYNLDTLSVVDSWPDPFGVLGDYPGQFVIIDEVLYAPKTGVGVIKWEPGSAATLIPNPGMLTMSYLTVDSNNKIVEVNGSGVRTVDPVDGSIVQDTPYTGIPPGRKLDPGGDYPLMVDNVGWYPLQPY